MSNQTIPPVPRSLLVALAFGATQLLASLAGAQCPPDGPPCAVGDDFVAGRWDLSALSGSYGLSGTERFHDVFAGLWDDYSTSGTLAIEMLGGAESNWVDVACDGTVTGQATERISGSISKNWLASNCINPQPPPGDMLWSVTIERTYSITGTVTGPGELELDLQVDTATIDLGGTFGESGDCRGESFSASVGGVDISGDTELVTLSGAWTPGQTTWSPTVSPRDGSSTWLEEIAYRLEIDGCGSGCLELELHPSVSQDPQPSYFEYLALTSVTITRNASADLGSTTPIVTAFSLDEPTAYLEGVSVATSARAEIDWRGEAPDQVEFTYGATVETVAGAASVTWQFDAGDPATTIEVVAIQGSDRSPPFQIAAPKVVVPGWAGETSDWSGEPGVQYAATLAWPVSLQTTQTLETFSLWSGLWGISAEAASTFEANASSVGTPEAGELETTASFEAAGKTFGFGMSGTNSTTLACDGLTTTGSATATLAGASWKKTFNPVTAIPGLEAAACGLSGLLCDVVGSVGLKASAGATLTGTATFTGEGEEIEWDGGSLAGSLTGKISATAGLPKPVAGLASVSVHGGGTGCLELMVVPQFELTQVAGDLEVGGSVSFLGLSAEAGHTWEFGGGCGRVAPPIRPRGGSSPFVPADGRLATAATVVDEELVGIAVWSELPAGQSRPSGDIHYRIWRDGVWGAIHALTDDADADTLPAVAFDPNDDPMIVWSRSVGPVPTMTSELPAFANGYELSWASIDLDTELSAADGVLTANTGNDFGAELVLDASGTVSLFWQRVAGIELLGTSAHPASILHATWDAGSAAWSPEEAVATGLEGVWGWSAAAHSADDMLVAFVEDGDGDAGTDVDREVVQVTRTAGVWMLPVSVTADAVADDSVHVAFDASGAPELLWRRDASVRQLRGDLGVPDELAFTSAAPAIDEGIGLGFGHGRVVTTSGGLATIWPDSTELLVARDLPDDPEPGWTVPESPFPSDEAQLVHSVSARADELLVGWSSRAFTAGGTGLEERVEPRFARLPGQPGIFADGFESGDPGRWSAVP